MGALRLICLGERVFPHDLTMERKRQAAPRGAELRPDAVRLSPREKGMLSVRGPLKQADRAAVGVTEATMKVHLKSVLHKIGVENCTRAAMWALANLTELDVALRAS